MDNEQTRAFESVSLLEMYSGEILACNKFIALSYDGKTASKLISEIKQRGGILASEALIMKVLYKDASDNLTIGFSDSDYDSILKFRGSKDYHKDADFIVARLSDDCDVQVLDFYINGKMPGLSNDNSSPWYFIAKKPENSAKYLSPSCYDTVYKTAISSEAEFMWDSITEKDSDSHYVMYATGAYKYLNAPKILKEI